MWHVVQPAKTQHNETTKILEKDTPETSHTSSRTSTETWQLQHWQTILEEHSGGLGRNTGRSASNSFPELSISAYGLVLKSEMSTGGKFAFFRREGVLHFEILQRETQKSHIQPLLGKLAEPALQNGNFSTSYITNHSWQVYIHYSSVSFWRSCAHTLYIFLLIYCIYKHHNNPASPCQILLHNFLYKMHSFYKMPTGDFKTAKNGHDHIFLENRKIANSGCAPIFPL